LYTARQSDSSISVTSVPLARASLATYWASFVQGSTRAAGKKNKKFGGFDDCEAAHENAKAFHDAKCEKNST
jgi:hypothetical protein